MILLLLIWCWGLNLGPCICEVGAHTYCPHQATLLPLFILILGFLVLGIEPRASYVLGKWCSPDYTLEPPLFISN